MELPATGISRRVLAVLTATALAASLVGLVSTQANAVVDDACYEEVIQYRAEKQQLVNGSWVRAAENLQLHGPNQWVNERPNLTNRPAGPWVENQDGEWFSQNMPNFKYVIFERTVDGDEIPCPEPDSGWACVDGEVVFIEDVDAFEGEETIYDSEEEAATDPNCVEEETTTTTTIPEETTTTVEVGETTVTTQPEETTTPTVEDEVLSETVTTQPEETTSSTAGDEVVAEELPFTGVDTGALAIVASALASLGLLTTLSARRIEE